jgi:putative heme-binding domain-containing protein
VSASTLSSPTYPSMTPVAFLVRGSSRRRSALAFACTTALALAHSFAQRPSGIAPAEVVSGHPNEPAAELASFTMADGFQATLFASEAEGIVKPIASRFDRFGRLWVIGSITYPQIKPGEAPNDYVRVLEDTNGDGKADKSNVFADGLMIPTGLEIDGDGRGCWVGEGTKLWHFRDEDGDGRAEKREVVLRGFGTGDNHQNINSFRWSPGGELFMSQGLHAFSRVETPWGVTRLDEAGYFRFRPRRQQLDAFWGGPADPQNPWGFAWDEWGALFVQAGNNGRLDDALPSAFAGGIAKRPPNIWPEAKGRKSSNPDLVENAHFPPEWQGLLITGGYINRAVWALKLTPDGAGWKAADHMPLIKSTHESFRPVDAKFGPDGALYVTDWYNPIIGHYQASFRHPQRDKAHGRIWRVTAKDRSLVEQPKVLREPNPTPEELFPLLAHGDRFARQQTKRLLASMPTEQVVSALRTHCARLDPNAPTTERVLFEALGVFEDHEQPTPAVLKRCLTAREPRLRVYAAGTLARWWDRLPVDFDVVEALVDLAHDAEPRVRLAAVVAAAHVPRPDSIVVVLNAGTSEPDKFLDYARQSAVAKLKPQWEPLLPKAEQLGWKPEWIAFLQSGGAPAKAEPTPAKVADSKAAELAKEAMRQGASGAKATPEFIAALVAEVQSKGDAKRGAEVYRRAELACTACHRVGNEGGLLGPDLNNIGSAQPLDFIIGAVLEPQREIKEGFEARTVRLRDGRVFTGFRRAAESGEMALFDAATQREHKWKAADVAETSPAGSLMPAGLVDRLSREDLRDLFAYLGQLGRSGSPGK